MNKRLSSAIRIAAFLLGIVSLLPCRCWAQPQEFIESHCLACHDSTTREAGVDLSSFDSIDSAEELLVWSRAYEQIALKRMPPAEEPAPSEEQRAEFLPILAQRLIDVERQRRESGAGYLRRMTRYEYENTIREVFDLPGIALANQLPADGSAHGFDKHTQALDLSHVTLAKYIESADQVLEMAIATQPTAPTIRRRRISLVNRGGFVAHVVGNGDGVLLRNFGVDPQFPPAANQSHLDEGAHERLGIYERESTVGLFRHEDESFNPYFIEHVTIYPGKYRIRTSLWSFQWDKGTVLPGRRTEVARLSVVQLTGDGRGGQHPSNVLGYFDAPSMSPLEHEMVAWLNRNELIGFNTASLAPAANYARQGRAMAFTGPGIACDWLEVEGPLHEVWPPASHQFLFGDLPLKQWIDDPANPRRPPVRPRYRQLGAGMNRPDPEQGLWTVHSEEPHADARRLLTRVLPVLFRRDVPADQIEAYASIFDARYEAGDCFETAMRSVYRTALCSPDFLYHLETNATEVDSIEVTSTGLDPSALACRLSYLLWNSPPDERLLALARDGSLTQPEVFHQEIERLWSDPRSERFIEDFVGQWLKLRSIASTDPDRTLYPEFSPYLQDAMVAETRGYIRELLDRNTHVSRLVDADWVWINDVLARHYGIEGIEGGTLRQVPLTESIQRGGLLTQGSILKITANGTTTSPVPRGAFILERILGDAALPPPESVPAIEPDVRGATTIREQLEKHRADAKCASCHRKLDPPGFALEAFDVIGGYRDRYRSIGEGDSPQQGSIDPLIPLYFKLGPTVDSSGEWRDGTPFHSPRDLTRMLGGEHERLLRNLASQWIVYATGRETGFTERDEIDRIVQQTLGQGGGLRTLLHEVLGSPLFHQGSEPITLHELPQDVSHVAAESPKNWRGFLMHPTLPDTPELRAERTDTVAQDRKPALAEPIQSEQWQEVSVSVVGLFEPDRVTALVDACQRIPGFELLRVNYDEATMHVRWAADHEMWRGTKLEEQVQRIDERVRHASGHTLGARDIPSMPRDQWQREELKIEGLDCAACSLAAYDIVIRVDGVLQAEADFGQSRAVAWIDPAKTNRSQLIEAFKQRGVVAE